MDKWMKNNNFNKILALALGIILWTIVHVDTAPASQTTVNSESKTIENVKVEVEGLDSDLYVMTKDVDNVRMEVRGKKSDLTYKFSDAYRVWLDLSEVKPGDNTLPLMYSTPSGVTLDDMVPNQVNVHIELRTTKAFPVSLNITGAPAEGYEVGAPVIEPLEAEVTLPASELGRVAKVQGNVELDGEKEPFSDKKLKLYAYDSEGNELKEAVITPSTAAVQVPVSLPSKTLPLNISFTGSLPGSLVLSRVTPDQDTVTVYGSKEILQNLSSYDAVLDLSPIAAAGTEQVKLALKPPEGTGKIEPAEMNVSVSSAEIAERTLSAVPVKLTGVGSGLTAVILEPVSASVDLTLTGAPTLLDQLDQDNVSIVADVGGFAAGIHDIPLQVSLPRFIALKSGTQQLSVRVELLVPATPEASAEAGDATNASTPEPSAEPASGEETPVEPSPAHTGEPVEPSPTPPVHTPENTATPAAGGSNNGSTGGT
ncbi:CdaR family protein [Paenibacillus sp. MMS20-IR301]|uniref:CdaR family protein n=1 Tax=Paenibacillus sp. MMS20-IR301 TaxID=2895946 RepID=UPI0028EB2343|nr:CdaR family protein [Paenibacillus sp. MMS20-IR301]WNS42867.1 CdaR family protein [Paenibacillus sp. MMS20-IR301]